MRLFFQSLVGKVKSNLYFMFRRDWKIQHRNLEINLLIIKANLEWPIMIFFSYLVAIIFRNKWRRNRNCKRWEWHLSKKLYKMLIKLGNIRLLSKLARADLLRLFKLRTKMEISLQWKSILCKIRCNALEINILLGSIFSNQEN